jgi:hypothetical protein
MRRSLCVATFSLILLALPVCAQRHGGGGGHVASGGGSHVASGGGFAHSSGSLHSGSFNRSSGVRLQVGSPAYRRRAGYGRRSYYPYYPYASYYPYGGYYGFYADPLEYQNSDDQSADSYVEDSPAPYPQDDGLQRDVQADVEARNRSKSDVEPETALVFRDQHVEEVRNYAIAGGTLWVFNDQSAKKIPLAQLDLDATAKMNDERGVDFQVPK